MRSSCLLIAALLAGCGARSGLQPDRVDAGVEPSDGQGQDAGSDASQDAADFDVAADVATEAVAGPCPTALPILASACAIEGQVCAYATGKQGPCGDVGQDDRVAYRCEEGLWLEIARCVDWSACPETPPGDGTVCDPALMGLDCFYSSDGCSPDGVVQCNGDTNWRHVNACAPRDVGTCTGLIPTLSDSMQTTVISGEQNVEYPSAAFAGTQMMLTYLASAGALPDHDIQGWTLQTAVPSQATAHVADLSDRLGRDAVTNPYVGFARDRFLLAWGANDGWPISTSGQPGTFLRPIPLQGQAGADVLVDPEGSAPTALSLGMEGGMLGYRIGVPPEYVKYEASVVSLDSNGQPVPASGHVVADESLEAWFAPPIPSAVARIARWQHGFVVAAPAPASGDLWDDSGFIVDFFSTPKTSYEPDAHVRVTAGLPSKLAVTALRDESVVAAFVPDTGEPQDGPPFQVFKIEASGTVTELEGPPATTEVIAGPQLTAFDDGFAAAWTTVLPEPGVPVATLHVVLFSRLGAALNRWDYDVYGMAASDRIAFDAVPVDRSLSLVWSVSSSGAMGSRILRQRFVCKSAVPLD